jgi:small redox-active disulfide protein 2
MKIEIFGTGCAKCEKLTEAAKASADKLNLDYEIEKIQDFNEIAKRGVLITPALAVDGTLKVVGRIPNDIELAEMLQQ